MALIVVVISLVGGSFLGALAGFFGGVLDDLIMRVADVTLAFPAIVLALAISALLGPSLVNAAIASCFVIWPEYARLMRSQVLVIRAQEHVLGGTVDWRDRDRHPLPTRAAALLDASDHQGCARHRRGDLAAFSVEFPRLWACARRHQNGAR